MGNEYEERKSLMRKIPGFRSGKIWKKVIAVIGYCFIALIAIGIFSGDGTTSKDEQSKVTVSTTGESNTITDTNNQEQTQESEQNQEQKEPEQNEEPEQIKEPEKTKEQTKETHTQTQVQPSDTHQYTLNEAAKSILREEFKEIKVTDYANDTTRKMVQVHFLGSDNLTTSFIRKGMIRDCADTLEKLYEAKIPIQEVTCFVYFPLQDKYGNTSEDVVMKLSLTGETEEKINWDGIDRLTFDNVADNYWEHPALRN